MFMLNSNEPIKVAHPQKLANQSKLNDALVIEMVKNSFSESKKNFCHLIKDLDKMRNVLIKNNRAMGSEKYVSTRCR